MHARSGGTLEVMGLMLGKVDGDTMIVMDAFALPVEGTETRVNAQAAAYEYMAAYIESAKLVGHECFVMLTCEHVTYSCIGMRAKFKGFLFCKLDFRYSLRSGFPP